MRQDADFGHGKREEARLGIQAAGDFARRGPIVVADDQNFSLEHFVVPLHYQGAVKELMIPHGIIIDR